MLVDSFRWLTVASGAVVLIRKQDDLFAPPTLSYYLFSSAHYQEMQQSSWIQAQPGRTHDETSRQSCASFFLQQ